ncbi:MAG: hypothetical protein K2K29_05385 [Muribaculaceae bacterium]|nr:hypothetical protein [Muribaculaceae bacterium]
MIYILNLNRLSHAVECSKYSKVDIAKKAGISRVTLDSALKGKEIGLYKFIQLIDILEQPIGYFFDNSATEIRQAGRDYHEHRDSIIGNKIIETNPDENLSYLEENRHLKNTIEQLKARIEDKDLIISLLKRGQE